MIDGHDVEAIATSLRRIADAIIPGAAAVGKDAVGGHVDSLTEAVMGITAGLLRVAEAIDNLADAHRESTRTRE